MNDTSPPRNFGLKTWQGCLLVGGVTAGLWWLCFQSPVFWVITGMGEANRPFIDLYGLLAACDARALGLDPFVPSNLDPYHRPHVYSEWWLALGNLGLGRKDVYWVGTLLVGILVANAVGMVRPRTWRECGALLAVLLSPAFLLAANRANPDLNILMLVSLGLICFRRPGFGWRAAGIGLFALSAVLKYFPLVTLVLLLDLRRRRDFVLGLALYVAVLLLALPGLAPGLRSAAQHAPEPSWFYAFGAPALMRDFELKQPILWLAPSVLLAGWALLAAWRQRQSPLPEQTVAAHNQEREFVCGALMIIGLFFLGASFVYKLIFAVWLLPWLWAAPAEAAEARWRRVMWWLLLAVLWFEGLMVTGFNLVLHPPVNADLFRAALVVQQLLDWALVACLTRFLLVYLGRWLRTLRPRLVGAT